jgi:hypothetical protein
LGSQLDAIGAGAQEVDANDSHELRGYRLGLESRREMLRFEAYGPRQNSAQEPGSERQHGPQYFSSHNLPSS